MISVQFVILPTGMFRGLASPWHVAVSMVVLCAANAGESSDFPLAGQGNHSVSMALGEYNQLLHSAYLQSARNELEKAWADLNATRKEHEREQSAGAQAQARIIERRLAIPGNWVLLNHTAVGEYQCTSVAGNAEMTDDAGSGRATFSFELELRVLSERWTVIPLVDVQAITSDWTVFRALDGTMDGAISWQSAPSTQWVDTMLILHDSNDQCDSSDFKVAEEHTLALATNRTGLYRVAFRTHELIRSTRNLHTLQLRLVHPLASTTLRLLHAAADGVQAEPVGTTAREFNVLPAALQELEETATYTELRLRVPPTRSLEVKWRGVDPQDVEAKAEDSSDRDGASTPAGAVASSAVTVEHEALHAVGEGLLQSSHMMRYKLSSEQTALPRARILVAGPARVTDVTGHGLKSWRISPTGAQPQGDEDSSSQVKEGQIAEGTEVLLTFEASLMSDTIIVNLATEIEFDAAAAAATVVVPSVVCQGVLRQVGSFAVVNGANVEVHESGTPRGVARIGTDELSSDLLFRTSNPIVFSYRYRSPQFHVGLSVVQHMPEEVLEAVVERAYYQTLVLDTQSMYRVLMTIQNTRRQYLRVDGLPENAKIWSLFVNSVASKPVRRANGELLVPLLVGLGGESNLGSGQESSVELAYIAQRGSLGDEGLIDLTPPTIDMPISSLCVEVQFPDRYTVNFTNASVTPVRSFSLPLPTAKSHDKGKDIVKHGTHFSNLGSGFGNQPAGVQVEIPRAGKVYKFERLLVVDEPASLPANYSLPPPKEEESWWSAWSRFR